MPNEGSNEAVVDAGGAEVTADVDVVRGTRVVVTDVVTSGVDTVIDAGVTGDAYPDVPAQAEAEIRVAAPHTADTKYLRILHQRSRHGRRYNRGHLLLKPGQSTDATARSRVARSCPRRIWQHLQRVSSHVATWAAGTPT